MLDSIVPQCIFFLTLKVYPPSGFLKHFRQIKFNLTMAEALIPWIVNWHQKRAQPMCYDLI